ncbi:MAG: hypothetical protein ACOY82_07795 [Pseudomonadota bacterium]
MSNPAKRHPVPSASVLIERALLGTVALGLVAMLSFPAARGVDATFGWLPFWLTALPLSAWATARTLRLHRATVRDGRPMARSTVRVQRWPMARPVPTRIPARTGHGIGLRRAA